MPEERFFLSLLSVQPLLMGAAIIFHQNLNRLGYTVCLIYLTRSLRESSSDVPGRRANFSRVL